MVYNKDLRVEYAVHKNILKISFPHKAYDVLHNSQELYANLVTQNICTAELSNKIVYLFFQVVYLYFCYSQYVVKGKLDMSKPTLNAVQC